MKKIIFIMWIMCVSIIFADDFDGSKYVNVKIYSDVSKIESSNSFWAILEITPQKAWHTYWINPGDAGLATSIEWQLPEGFIAESPVWQYPERVKFEEFANFGYSSTHYLMVRIKTPSVLTDKDYDLKAKVNFLVCKEKCIPGSKDVKLVVSKTKSNNIGKEKFDAIRMKIPVEDHKFRVSANIDGENVIIKINKSFNTNDKLKKIEFFPLEEGVFQNVADGNFQAIDNYYQLKVPFDKMRTKTPNEFSAVLVGDQSFFKGFPRNAIQINVTLNK